MKEAGLGLGVTRGQHIPMGMPHFGKKILDKTFLFYQFPSRV